jgi:hypothetical protein
MFGQNKKRINRLKLKPFLEMKPMNERCLDVYWDLQIKKAKKLDELEISPETKLKKLSWNSWISLTKSTFTYLTDLPKNFYNNQIEKNEILYLSPLRIKELYKFDKAQKINNN